jgi:hypothetical protein
VPWDLYTQFVLSQDTFASQQSSRVLYSFVFTSMVGLQVTPVAVAPLVPPETFPFTSQAMNVPAVDAA